MAKKKAKKESKPAMPGSAKSEKRRPLKGGEPFHPKGSLVKMRGC